MDIRKVKKLIELLEESGIAEIEINEGEESVRISRYPTSGPAMPMQPMPMQPYAAPMPVVPVAVETAAADETDASVECAITGHTVNAPMVGTFYMAASPCAPYFCNTSVERPVGAHCSCCLSSLWCQQHLIVMQS